MVFISEVFPNPRGNDVEGEYIKISNYSQSQVSLSGWRLSDASGKSFLIENQVLPPYGSLVFSYATTKISLNNSGDTVFLYDAEGKLIDRLAYQENIKEDTLLIKKFPNENLSFVSLDKPLSVNSLDEKNIGFSVLEESYKSNFNHFDTEKLVSYFQLRDVFSLGFFVSLFLTLIFWVIFKKIEKNF